MTTNSETKRLDIKLIDPESRESSDWIENEIMEDYGWPSRPGYDDGVPTFTVTIDFRHDNVLDEIVRALSVLREDCGLSARGVEICKADSEGDE